MEPVSPMIPGLEEVSIAKDQPEYDTLPAAHVGDKFGTVITRWRMSWRERWRALWYGEIYLHVLTFGRPLQPVLLEMKPPEVVFREGGGDG